MRRSENRGNARETFASNSRDSQDLGILFLSATRVPCLVPQYPVAPPEISTFLRAFRERLSLFAAFVPMGKFDGPSG